MDSPSAMAPMQAHPHHHHHPADRLAAHAAALQPAQFPATVAPELTQHHPQTHASPDVSNWAADFSKFASTQRPAAQQPRQRHQQHQHQPMFQNAFGMQQQPGTAFSPFFAPAGSAYGGQIQAQQQQAAPAGEADFDKEMAQWMASNSGSGNMEQVDAAMEQMARELELNEASLATAAGAHGVTEEEVAEAVAAEEAHFSDLGVPELSNLTLESRTTGTGTTTDFEEQLETLAEDRLTEDEAAAAAREKSAVSEAAERLLESVQHENGEKWQNSVFLQLMRDFRDGRKDIVDNEVRQMEGEGEGGQGSGEQQAGAEEAAAAAAAPATTA